VIVLGGLGFIINNTSTPTSALEEMYQDDAPDYITDYEELREDMKNSRAG